LASGDDDEKDEPELDERESPLLLPSGDCGGGASSVEKSIIIAPKPVFVNVVPTTSTKKSKKNERSSTKRPRTEGQGWVSPFSRIPDGEDREDESDEGSLEESLEDPPYLPDGEEEYDPPYDNEEGEDPSYAPHHKKSSEESPRVQRKRQPSTANKKKRQ